MKGDIIFVIEVLHYNRNGRTLLDKTFTDYYKAYDHVMKLLEQEKYKTNTYYINEYKQID